MTGRDNIMVNKQTNGLTPATEQFQAPIPFTLRDK
jgi:hypothetical protein